jgi:hypothetical protein
LGEGYEPGWKWPKQIRNSLSTDGANVGAEHALRVAGSLKDARGLCLGDEENAIWLNRAGDMDRLAVAFAQIDIGNHVARQLVGRGRIVHALNLAGMTETRLPAKDCVG